MSLLAISLGVACAVVLSNSDARGQPAANPVVDVLAHGSGECFWAARVAPVAPIAPSTDTTLETIVHARFSGPAELRPLARINAAVVDLTNRGTQLIVLLGDGQWRIVWPGGSATGAGLGAQAHAIAIAGEGQRLWAVAVVRDGFFAQAALVEASTTAPATRSAAGDVPLWSRAMRRHPPAPPAATSSASRPAEIVPSVDSATRPASRPTKRLVLFRLDPGGQWQAYAELPEELFVESPTRISLNVGSVEQPSVAVALDDDQIHIQRLTRERQWKDLGRIATDAGATEFDWVAGMPRPTLWVAGPAGPGRLLVKEDRGWRSIDLEASDPIAAGEQRAISMALDRIRLLYTYHGKVFEQRYEPGGARLGEATELALSAPTDDMIYYRWINLAAMVALVLAMFGSVRRRRGMSDEQVMRAAGTLAPVGARVAAAAIDALPAMAGMFIVGRRDEWLEMSMPTDTTLAELLPLWIGLAVYILHTMLSEMIWGRSLGKKIFGLRVVLMDGARAGWVPILLRNLLRLAELPIAPVVFIMMLYSPLRQRAGDIAAATIVISEAEKPDDTQTE